MHTQCLQCDSRSQWYFHCPLSLQITSESLINTPSRGGSLTAPALLLLPSPSTSLCHILIPALPLWSCCLTSPNDSATLTLPEAFSSVSNRSLWIPLSTCFSQTLPPSFLHLRQTENYRQIKRAVFLYQGYRQSVRSGKQQKNINETNVREMAAACSDPPELKHPIITDFLKLYPGLPLYWLSNLRFRSFRLRSWRKKE